MADVLTPELVPHDVSQAKLDDQLQDWHRNGSAYRRRGWVLLGTDDLTVDVAFVTRLPIAGDLVVPAMPVAIRLNFANYDLWPPSLTFIDPILREPAAPLARAIELVNGEPRDALLVHPETQAPFLCMPGVREYHAHPQHTGDDWLLHRSTGAGRLAVICDIVWRRMIRNVIGVEIALQSVTGGTNLRTGILQGEIQPNAAA